MPRMDAPPSHQTLAKLLLIGDGKLGKSWYAALAAIAGFNILYIDGDVGAQTIGAMVKKGILTKEQASRIYLLDVGDTIEGGLRDTKFAEFMTEFTSNITIRWNDTKQRIATKKDTPDEVWEIKPGLMGPNDLIVMDSWTGYTESLMTQIGRANGVDISNASTSDMRPVYQGGALKTAQMLQMIRSAPTNVIVIAHPDEYSHTTKPEGKKTKDIKETDLTVDWTKLIPKTTSKPQGLVMAKYFTDVAWMELSPAGTERRLNFKPKNDRISGGHFDDSKSVEEYSFVNLVKELGGSAPTPSEPTWLKIIPPGELTEAEQVSEKDKVLDGTKATQIKSTGMSSIFQKKPAATPAETA